MNKHCQIQSLQEEEQAIEEIDMEEDAQETDNLEGHPEIKRLGLFALHLCSSITILGDYPSSSN